MFETLYARIAHDIYAPIRVLWLMPQPSQPDRLQLMRSAREMSARLRSERESNRPEVEQ